MGLEFDIYLKKPYYHGKAKVLIKVKNDSITVKELKKLISNKTGLQEAGVILSGNAGVYPNEELLDAEHQHVMFSYDKDYLHLDQTFYLSLKRAYKDHPKGFYQSIYQENRKPSVYSLYNRVRNHLENPRNLFIFHRGKLLSSTSMKQLEGIDAGPCVNLEILAF